MVYQDLDILGKNEEDDEEGQPQQVTPVSSGQPGAVNPSAPQPPQQERKGSGKFTNIKKYVDANTTASQKLGQGIQNKIGSEAENVRKGIESAQNQFQQGAQQVEGTLNKATGYAQQVGQAGGAQQIADVEPEFKTFRDIYTGQVKGPNETISSQKDNAAKLQALSQLAGNEAGRFQLLDETYTKPTQQYSRGQKRFDQLLLQGTPDVAKNIQEFGKQQVGNIQQKFSDVEKAQQAEVKRLMDLGLTQKQALESATGKTFGEEDTGAFGGAYKELTAAQEAAKTKQEADVAALQNYLKNINAPQAGGTSGKLTQEQAALLNLDPNMRTYGLDLSQFAPNLRISDTDITKADIANQEQQARLNALYKLTGQDPSGLNLGEKFGRIGADLGTDINEPIENQLRKLTQSKSSQFNPYAKSYIAGTWNGQDLYSDLNKFLLGTSATSNKTFNPMTSAAQTEFTKALLTGQNPEEARQNYINALENFYTNEREAYKKSGNLNLGGSRGYIPTLRSWIDEQTGKTQLTDPEIMKLMELGSGSTLASRDEEDEDS